MMKKILTISILWIIMGIAYAHPGDDLEDYKGCHTCRTNCTSWWLDYWEFHCHEKKSSCWTFFNMSENNKIVDDALKYTDINKDITISSLTANLDYLYSQKQAILQYMNTYSGYKNILAISSCDILITWIGNSTRNEKEIILNIKTGKTLLDRCKDMYWENYTIIWGKGFEEENKCACQIWKICKSNSTIQKNTLECKFWYILSTTWKSCVKKFACKSGYVLSSTWKSCIKKKK